MLTEENIKKIIANHSTYIGLTTSEVETALRKFGYNERPRAAKKGWLKRFWGIVSEPMIALIFITGGIYFFLGEKTDAIILLFSIIPIVLLEFFQESRTDQAIEALDAMVSEICHVYRDGKIVEIATKLLVPGDLVYLTAGDKISADGILLRCSGLMVDESILTGESVAVVRSEIIDGKISEENRLNQGTLVTQGEGYMLVEKIGGNTAYGKLGNLLEKINAQDTPLQIKIHNLVRLIAIVAVAVAVLVTLALAYFHGWVEGVLGGLTIAMSLIPEEFPVVFSVFLIMGVWRMSKHNALVREMKMVETLGSATVICTDKTGTLTEGRMSLKKIYYDGHLLELSTANKLDAGAINLIQSSLLALERVAIDPMEVEVQKFALRHNIDVEKFFDERTLLADSAFNAVTKMVHHIWKIQDDGCYQYSAGAPESVIEACDLSAQEKESLLSANAKEAGDGLRVIAVARRAGAQDGEVVLTNMKFMGFLIMSDPPRVGVREAMEVCQKAGIRIIMITGDNKLTAHNIAESINLKHNEEIINGDEIEKLFDVELAKIVSDHNIFARVKPEHKYRIVEALQKNGEVVAMTGDGVNDAPALKKANIGIAMGKKGTEVARAAAGIILLDDNFSTIVKAVHEGRRIYDNLRHAFVFLFSFHLPIIGMALVPILFRQPLVFLPIHIIFLELICDPVSVLGFEREPARRNLMSEPPRPANEPLINPRLWTQVLIQGLSIFAVSFGCYYYFCLRGGNLDLGRSTAFVGLVWSQILVIIFSREWSQIKSNRLMWLIISILCVVLLVALFVPAIHDLFKFAVVPTTLYELIFILPLIFIFFTTTLTKRIIRKI